MTKEVILNKRYRLLTEIGAGRVAVVFRGEDTWRGVPVAVKVLRQACVEDEAFLARLHSQAQAVVSLVHPNIVTTYEVGQEGDRHYLVMELVEEPTLKELIQVGIPFSIGQAVDVIIQICTAVGYAHRLGIVHGDIKPQNVFVSADGRVKVADFGIASALSPAPVVEGEIVWGTPHYFSPEQAAGENVSPASDVYSIGVVVYEMLTGRPPFEAETDIGVALKRLREEPVPLRQLNPDVPLQVERIVRKVMAKEPAARYRTADQLGRILDSYRRLDEEALVVRPPTVTKPQPRRREPEEYEAVARPQPRRYEPEEYEEEEKRQDWLAIFLGVVAIMAVLCLIPLLVSVYQRYTAAAPQPTATAVVTPLPGQVQTPDLVGLAQEEARRLVEAAGLQLAVVGERHDSSIPALNVIAQTIPAGQMVRQGETIGVIISQGPRFVSVPAVEGLPITAAEPGLKEMGLNVSRKDIWSREAEGLILSQQPAAGSIVSEGSVVTLVVSSGPRLMLNANLGSKVLLVACDLENDSFKPGELLRLTLHWRALQPMQENYTVFVHVTRADGVILAQRDVQPRDGTHPTGSWVTGELVRDSYELSIPGDAPPDIYWLKVGMYSQATMQRLPVVDPGQATVVQDSVLVKELRVLPAQ
ncbi:MAG: PASTA domain-containing protein [Chloroflexi bacterium]|nr:PASTA domain-containing protein [Chloroflexota bacterium]